jgi:hypothetical protein
VQLQPRHIEPLPNQEPHCIGHPDAAQEHTHLESGPTGSPIGPELGPVEHVKNGLKMDVFCSKTTWFSQIDPKTIKMNTWDLKK